tara:strand:- start:338 stop:565 length:228 start_codon:yes stop_codon:yes gene_type:complete
MLWLARVAIPELKAGVPRDEQIAVLPGVSDITDAFSQGEFNDLVRENIQSLSAEALGACQYVRDSYPKDESGQNP